MKTSHVLQLLLLSAIWGMSFLLISLAGQVFPPFWVGLLRGTFGAILLWIVLLAGKHQLPPRRLFVWLFLVALFNNAIPFVFFARGEQNVPSSTASILNATTPIWTLLISLTVHKIRASTLVITGVLLGFAGVMLVVYGQDSVAGRATTRAQYLHGVAYIACAALGYGIATNLAKMKLQGLDPIGLATTQLSLASLILLPVALIGPHPSALKLTPVAAMVALGFIGSGLAFLIYYNLLAHSSATHVTAVTYIIPIWGLFWGHIAHETIGWTAYAGVAIVIIGLVLLNFRAFQAAKTPVAAIAQK
jgi:drug/metabolite transporter (DMT)-like permease